jgi:hypothetical protein
VKALWLTLYPRQFSNRLGTSLYILSDVLVMLKRRWSMKLGIDKRHDGSQKFDGHLLLLERDRKSMQSIVHPIGSDGSPDLASSNDVSNLICNILNSFLDIFDRRYCVIMPDWSIQDELEIFQCVVHGAEFALK